jgi:hypothetical protein
MCESQLAPISAGRRETDVDNPQIRSHSTAQPDGTWPSHRRPTRKKPITHIPHNIKLNNYRKRGIPLVHVNACLLADQVGKATANTLDLGQGVHHLVLTIDVGVQDTQDVLKFFLVNDQRLCDRDTTNTRVGALEIQETMKGGPKRYHGICLIVERNKYTNNRRSANHGR